MIADLKNWERDNKKYEELFEKVVNALKTEDSGKEGQSESKLGGDNKTEGYQNYK